jgi:hypothetical protein
MKSFFKAHPKLKQTIAVVWEIGKWMLVVWLLLPLRHSMTEHVNFSRILLGILLFVLFGGKVFYDTVLDSYKKRPERKPIVDLIVMVGSITVIALIVGITIVFIGYFIFNGMQETGDMQQ